MKGGSTIGNRFARFSDFAAKFLVVLGLLGSFAQGQSAVFRGTDEVTKGGWKLHYGAKGYLMPEIGQEEPIGLDCMVSGQHQHSWAPVTPDIRGLEHLVGGARTAACWFSGSSGAFEIDVTAADPHMRLLSLYCLDWDGLNRSQSIEIRSSPDNVLLDSRTISQFQNGIYLRWNISGDVRIKVINNGPANAVLSGVFFDGSVEDPGWWRTGESPVIKPSALSNNKGPANLGQAKWMAKKALDALRLVSVVTADAVESDLVGPGNPIPNWNVPSNAAEHEMQRAPLLIGQLKAISKPFYDHLNTFNPLWLAKERTLNGTATVGTYFPWSVETTDDANKAAATIGQLKAVFALRFEAIPTSPTGPSGLPPASWYVEFFGDAELYGPDDDPDGDGKTNAQEYLDGSDPSDGASHSRLLKLVVHTRLE